MVEPLYGVEAWGTEVVYVEFCCFVFEVFVSVEVAAGFDDAGVYFSFCLGCD